MSEVVDYIKKSFDLKNKGYYKPAIEMLYKALTIEEDNLEILAQLAHVYKLLGNFDRAVYYIEKVMELDAKHLECLALLLEIRLLQDDLESALSISDKIFTIKPVAQNLVRKLNILNKLQNFAEIVKLQSLDEKLFDDEVYYEFASAYYMKTDFEKAKELLKSGYAKNNKNDKLITLLAKIHYDSGEFEDAEKLFKKLSKIAPTHEIMNYLGLLKLNEQSFDEAVDYFMGANKGDEKNSEYAYNLASAYFLNGWLDEALKFFNLAICLDAKNISYHYALAYLYYQKESYDKAQKELDFIKSLEPEHVLSNVLNAMIIAKSGDLVSSKNVLESIVKSNKNDDFAFSALSGIYFELSNFELAKEMILHSIELKPNSLEYLRSYADICVKQKNIDEALEIVEKMQKINQRYLPAYLISAKIYYEASDFDKLYDIAQEIIELDSNSMLGYYYNAISLFEQGDTNFAIESLKKAISLDLNNISLYIKMSEFYQDLGDFKNAYDWAKEACEVDERSYKSRWLCAKLAMELKNEDDVLKYYSQSYRIAPYDKELAQDYANYLISAGKKEQAEKILR